jgi:hypothetical protein
MRPIYILFYFSYRSVGGLWYWMRRRFTTPGLFVGAGFFLAGTTGLDIENTVTYQSFTLLLALLTLSGASCFFFRARFSATRILPRVGTVGQPLHYRVQIKNLTAKVQQDLIFLENVVDPRPAFPEWLAFQMAENRRVRPFRMTRRRQRNPFRVAVAKAAEIPPLAANGEIEAGVELLPLRRGILRLAGMTVARADPFGLFRSFFKIHVAQMVLILPKRYSLPPITLPGSMRYQEGGVALAANIGRSEEFVALREYRHGDPLRHIHWRSWAKVGKPIVKEFEDEFFVRHALVLDTFDDEPNSDLLEEAVAVAASFACTVLTQESLLDLLFVGNQTYCFTAGRGLAHAEQMLEILASVKNCADKPFTTLEQLVLNHVAIVSGCICILQKWDEARQGLIKKLKALGVPLLVLIIVPPDVAIPGAAEILPAAAGRIQILEMGKIEATLARLQ